MISTIKNVLSILLYFTRILKFFLFFLLFLTILDLRTQLPIGASHSAVGTTRKSDVGAVVGQGTMGGALVSQAVLDEAVMERFPLAGQLNYGSVPMAPVMWVDDMLNAARGLDEARLANKQVDSLIKQRGLQLNQGKSL